MYINMGPNPIMQARSDFYDDDSIICTHTHTRIFPLVCRLLSFSFFICWCLVRYLRSFVCLSANRCHRTKFLIYFWKMWVILSKNMYLYIYKYIWILSKQKQSQYWINTVMLCTLAKILLKYLIFNYSNGKISK